MAKKHRFYQHPRAYFYVFAGFLTFLSLEENQLPLSGEPQKGKSALSDRNSQRSALSMRESQRAGARELFQQHCVRCHRADGKGGRTPDSKATAPNFTDPSWHKSRTDAQLPKIILDGKGQGMPSFRGKITDSQARELAEYVRAFAPGVGKAGNEKSQEPKTTAALDEEFRRLQKELAELKRQAKELPDTKGKTEARSQPPDRPKPAEPAQPSAPVEPGAPSKAGTPAEHTLFQQHCVRCHGADGKGTQLRRRLPEIPDFTDAAWQAKHSDTQIVRAIQDGKGKEMPTFGEKLVAEEIRSLAVRVRSFAPRKPSSEPERSEQSTMGRQDQEARGQLLPTDATDQAEFVQGFPEKLIAWLGRFHPLAVHFPIALLIAAAVSELVYIVTGKPAYADAARACAWFGAAAALIAAALGWCAGGFQVTDEQTIKMTHRWLGTGTFAWAALVLLLSELRRRADHRSTRLWFRLAVFVGAVLVLLTGYFGGMLVYGVDHYNWPE